MLDGAELAAEPDLDVAVRRYEARMFPRSAAAAGFAAEGIDHAVTPDGPAHTLAVLAGVGRGGAEQPGGVTAR
jgi:hypothetical protein